MKKISGGFLWSCPQGCSMSNSAVCLRWAVLTADFFTFSLPSSFCGQLSDLWPQSKNIQHHLTFSSNKISGRRAPLNNGGVV